jgi:hypothetical protein
MNAWRAERDVNPPEPRGPSGNHEVEVSRDEWVPGLTFSVSVEVDSGCCGPHAELLAVSDDEGLTWVKLPRRANIYVRLTRDECDGIVVDYSDALADREDAAREDAYDRRCDR